MPAPQMMIDQHDLVLHFETQDMIDADLFFGLMTDVLQLARRDEHAGAKAEVRIAELRTGSLTVRLKFSREDLRDGFMVAGFGIALATYLQTPSEPAAQKCSQIMVDQSVRYLEVLTASNRQIVERDNPAVRALLQMREEAPPGVLTFGGEPVTLRGEYVTLGETGTLDSKKYDNEDDATANHPTEWLNDRGNVTGSAVHAPARSTEFVETKILEVDNLEQWPDSVVDFTTGNLGGTLLEAPGGGPLFRTKAEMKRRLADGRFVLLDRLGNRYDVEVEDDLGLRMLKTPMDLEFYVVPGSDGSRTRLIATDI